MTQTTDHERAGWRGTAVRITLIYAAIGMAWILLSDRVVEAVARDLSHSTVVQTIKGIGYVMATAGLLYWLVARASRRDAEQKDAIAERERRLRAVLDSAPVAIITVQDRRIRYVNAAALVLLSAPSQDDLLGRPITELFDPRDHEELLRDIELASAGQRCLVHEDQAVTTLGGEELLCEVNISGKTYTDPNTACMVLIDRTERRRLEEALTRARLMETVGQMAAGIAHDFNNVLLVIQGHVDLLEQALPAGDGARTSLRRIEEAAGLASGIATSLMGLTRDSAWAREPVHIASVVQEATRLLRAAMGRRVTMEVEIDPDAEVTVLADRTKLLQVVLNLALNARDAMPDGGAIRLRLERTAQHQVALRVRDNGVGIPDEIVPRIFDPLFTTKPPGLGAGLGLTITRHIVEEYDGRIEVASRPSEGTEFTVLLPIAQQAPPPVLSRQTTALLGDGHDLIRPIIARMLRAVGCDVIEAATGGDLLARAEAVNGEIGLIVIDDAIPDPGVAEVLRALRHRGVTAPAIVVCSDATAARQATQGLDPVSIIAKPFAIADLRAVVVEAISSHAAR